jgi:L-alanine-DL-glutamate epimerase-like enolase superfamily enzyme
MRIQNIESIPCELGWRTLYYLKVTTDEGLVGWSEFTESFGNPGLSHVIDAIAPRVIGQDPMRVQLISHDLDQVVRPARGGLARQAVAAIENALLDIKGKALGVPVAGLLGGAVHERVPVYWSHCGTYRVGARSEHLDSEPLRTYDDVVEFARHVRERGFFAMKTNILSLEDPELAGRPLGFARVAGTADRVWDSRKIGEAVKVLSAFRDGAGEDAHLFFDVNYGFEVEGYLRLEREIREFRPAWLELDTFDPKGLALIRQAGETPIGSGEGLYERAGYRPFFEQQAFDVAIIDVPWNGFLESLKIAAQAETYSVPVAPHNFYGHLSTAMSAQFCAAVPNINIMEIDIDGLALRDEVVTPPTIEDGYLIVSTEPGWGVEVDEERLRFAASTLASAGGHT